MLGRKILKRITRLGLSFYATVWCMSFTVCAYDNPLADMAVSDRMSVYAEDTSDLSSALNEGAQLPEDVEMPEDTGLAVQEETIPPDVTELGDDDNDVTALEPLSEDDQGTEEQPENEDDVLPSDVENTEDTEEPGEDVLPEDAEETDEIDEDVIEVLDNESEDLISDVEEIEEDELVNAAEVDGFYLASRSAAREWSSEYYNTSRVYDYGFACSGSIRDTFDEFNASTKTEFRAIKDIDNIEEGFIATDNQYGGIHFVIDRYEIDSPTYKKIYVNATIGSDWKQSNGYEFYIVGRYEANGNYYYSKPYHVDIYIPVNNTLMYVDNDSGWDCAKVIELPKSVINTEVDPDAIENFSQILLFNSTHELFADRISWSVMEEREDGNYTVGESRGIVVNPVDDTNQTVKVTLNDKFSESGHFVIQASYDNNFKLSNGTERRPRFESSFASAVMDIEYSLPRREAHLSEPAVKVQIFNSTNVVPVTLRIENETKSQSFRYEIIDVKFEDDDLNEYLEVSPYGGKSVNLKARNNLVNMDPKALAKFVKNKYSTKLNITAKVNGITEILTTKENLIITFGNKLPTAKDLKYNNTLTFNSFYVGQQKGSAYLDFESPYIDKVVAEDPVKLKAMGLMVHENGTVDTLNDTLPAAKKGSFNVYVNISDSSYNLPENFTIKTKVNYVVKNEAPVIYDLTTNNVLLNSRLNESCLVEFDVKDCYDTSADIAYKVLDKNNKELSVNPLNISLKYYYYLGGGYLNGYLNISCSKDTPAGQTYKISLYPVNRYNNRTGAAKVITVKTVAEKNQLNPSITAKGKGSIDACNPYSSLNISLTAKNCNLFGKAPSLDVRLENNTDITGYFEHSFDYEANVLYVWQNTIESRFPLLEKEYAGQKITITAGFNLTGGSELYNLTYSTKIGASKVTPKLKTKSITINPYYYSDQRFYVMLTNQYSYLYDYDCVIDFGKDKSGNNITHPFIASSGSGEIVIQSTGYSIPSSLYGKTGTLKITPNLPGVKVGTATCKISILDPAKSKASMTLKAKGSIDAIKNPYDSYVNITTSFKNVGYTDASYVDVKCINITTMVNGEEVSVNRLFNNYTYSGNVIRIRRNAYENLTAGTYKAYIQARYRSEPLYTAGINGTGVPQVGGIIEKTVTFKVTRGKAGTSFTPSPIKLINRDYTRYADVNIAPKTKGVTGISYVEIVDAKYNDKLKISRKYGNTYQLEFANNFYETSKVGKLILAITKSVTKTIKVNVYYIGSEIPEKVNLKVKITP